MAWKKRQQAQSEIGSTQWALRTAREGRPCESPITREGYAAAHPHTIAKGERYARNDYWAKSYCLGCFRGWAPAVTVRKLGLEPQLYGPQQGEEVTR